MLRRITRIRPSVFPIVEAHEILLRVCRGDPITDCEIDRIEQLAAQGAGPAGHRGWGLGMPWMSKNGLYRRDVPLVTHTLYVMEALLALGRIRELRDRANRMFLDTWGFLKSLKVMHESESDMAVSYAPVAEPRIVVNANAYAAYGYALHSRHGAKDRKETAFVKASALARWVVRQQRPDGEWWYYADRDHGNFVDGFHSCFVIKNLLKAQQNVPELRCIAEEAIRKGWQFLKKAALDKDQGLCRRILMGESHQPYRWDLYDQAEFLGLLVDFAEIDEATRFARRVRNLFRRNDHWYCRIDFLGRRWGKDFDRWGILPFLYHESRISAISTHRVRSLS
ncbi:MAG: hypothetical protein ACE5IK_02240 [Acidobacteriota bacterium]